MFLFQTEPPKTPLIDIFTETKIEIQIEPELTVQEKIDANHYNCDEATQYIRKDNAECLNKPVQAVSAPIQVNTRQTVQKRSEPIKRSSNTAHSGWYPSGQCTAYVASRRPVGQWNNATQWKSQAIADGYTHSTTPVAGAIAWRVGHVGYVESVNNDGTIVLSEQNYDWNGSIRTITIPASQYSYLY